MTVVGSVPYTFDVDGPVQAEVFVVWLNGEQLELSGPCGAEPWYIEVNRGEDPVQVVSRVAQDALGPPRLVHSTSWRRDRDAVILTFTVVVDPAQVQGLASAPIARAELARSEATRAPEAIAYAQVLEHGLRHLAWLARDDPVVSAELSPGWHAILTAYVPEPFRGLSE
jgi:hypothetical protein